MSTWREGARRGDPEDACPACGAKGVLTLDFRKFGQHSVKVCDRCKTVSHNGNKVAELEEAK